MRFKQAFDIEEYSAIVLGGYPKTPKTSSLASLRAENRNLPGFLATVRVPIRQRVLNRTSGCPAKQCRGRIDTAG